MVNPFKTIFFVASVVNVSPLRTGIYTLSNGIRETTAGAPLVVEDVPTGGVNRDPPVVSTKRLNRILSAHPQSPLVIPFFLDFRLKTCQDWANLFDFSSEETIIVER
jgi:hypothetical protein